MNLNNLSGDNWQNFIYLSLILLILAGGIISNRDISFKKSLKYLSAWSVIALIFISLYSYRYEFSDFKSRLMGEINPASAQFNRSGEMIINIARDGHFYLDTIINSSPIRFMIDTGASDIVISMKEAERVGIRTNKLIFNRPYQTANGISWGAKTTLEKMEVEDLLFYDVPASVNSADMGTSLLGMSFLRKFHKYEFYRDKLVLTP